MLLEKRIIESLQDLKDYCEAKGFIIDNNEMRWGYANQDSNCYWTFDDTNETMNFIDSDGNEAFPYSLCDFSEGRVTGVAFLPLKDNGCAIQITGLPEGSSSSDFTVSCALGYNYNSQGTRVIDNTVPHNGLVVCTPEEEDGYWRYSWRAAAKWSQSAYGGTKRPSFQWCIDDCRHNVIPGKEIPTTCFWEVSNVLGLSKVMLTDGIWSNYIYMQIMGLNAAPGQVFKINGQTFISFYREDGTEHIGGDTYVSIPNYRPPCFMLPEESILINDPTSTKEYSRYTKYKENDYCTYRGLVYRCLTDINIPEPFDITHWQLTTVPNELLRN